MARVRDGVAGWLSGLLPLILINVLGSVGLLNTEEALLAGSVALLGGPVLGGVIAGLLGGRVPRSHTAQPGRANGAWRAAPGAAIAAALYLASLAGLVVLAAQLDSLPSLIAEHPIRTGVAIVWMAAVLLAVALGVGWLGGRRAAPASAAASRPPASRPARPPHAGAQGGSRPLPPRTEPGHHPPSAMGVGSRQPVPSRRPEPGRGSPAPHHDAPYRDAPARDGRR